MKKGLIQLYTGNGKGKSTAAFGLALRAAGRGMRVVILQFLKGDDTGEVMALENALPAIEVRRYNSQKKFIWLMTDEERNILKGETMDGIEEAQRLMTEQACDILILDEVTWAVENGLISLDELIELIRLKPESMELVITGAEAAPELIEAADLVTEMRSIKHPFDSGMPPREGIEQ